MSLMQVNWRPGKADLRKFGITVSVGLAAVAGVLFWKGHVSAAESCVAAAAVVGILGGTATRAALPVYWAWMGVSFAISAVMSRVIFSAFFFGVITPTALIMRLSGRDKLKLRKKGALSYWQEINPQHDVKKYERQF